MPYGPDRHFKYLPFPPSKFVPTLVKPYVMPKDRPLRERLALVLMRRSELAVIVRAALMETDAPPVRVSDFLPLVEDGLAARDGDWHRLTAGSGVTAADQVIEAFARQLGIHHRIVSGGNRFQHAMRCTCGRTFSHSINEGHWASAQMRLWSKHLEEIEQAKARGETYVPGELKALLLIAAPPIAAEG